MPIQAYPWTLLNTTRGWRQSFTSAGTYDTHLLQFSISGVTRSEDIRVELDGKDLGWEVNPLVGVDRFIYQMTFNESLAPGRHELGFTLLNDEIQGQAQVCMRMVLRRGSTTWNNV
jgi:hypothetical protein